MTGRTTKPPTKEDRRNLSERTILASVSGGKDSTAMALWLKEHDLPFRAVFLDTGWEHPWTTEYALETLPKLLGVEVEAAKSHLGGFGDLVKHRGMFPHRTRRFCTQELKIRPFERFAKTIPGKVVNCVGIRAGESRARSKMPRWSVEAGLDAALLIWRPLIEWTFDDVAEIHRRHGVLPNPLYLKCNVERVGCWPCIFSRKAEIAAVAKHDSARIDEIRDLEADVQESARQRYEGRGETFESLGYVPPTFFSRAIKNDVKTGHAPIDDVVAWSKTKHGGKQMALDIPQEEGCVRWGMCEHPDLEDDDNA